MDLKFFLGIGVAVVIVFFTAAFAAQILKNSPADAGTDTDTLYQVSTINALMQGSFDGTEPVSETLNHGDFGIGTFDGLDGEMIVLDGKVYQARADGSVSLAAGTMTTPFATVTRFENDFNITTTRRMNLSEFILEQMPKLPSQNLICAVRFHGTFPAMKVRAIPKQNPPYPTLSEAAKNQSVFQYPGTTGTVVGLYMPSMFEGLNVPGYHLHYISDDRKTGGHILDMTAESGTAVIYDMTNVFEMSLPTEGTFTGVDLSQDLSKELAKVER